MEQCSKELRERYTFFDFLFYTCLLAVPLLAAAVAIGRNTVGGLLVFILLAVVAAGLVLKFFCSRCPHYTREDKLLRCMFFWDLPKFFAARPGELDTRDRIVTWAAPAVLLAFPLIWLIHEPDLLAIFLLSLAGFAAAVRRHECHRCIYFACPINKASDEMKDETE
ncbi:hypothetical protein [uncultured Desulfosarcina sp.]|uniref:hypothetical protein n=1 Tax=uncultured Desulfosarcina sp. TaxID=218289 RepID=UPI0029C86603|nr:hypothetical protein [uncultured Desulfosarcina sp.]